MVLGCTSKILEQNGSRMDKSMGHHRKEFLPPILLYPLQINEFKNVNSLQWGQNAKTNHALRSSSIFFLLLIFLHRVK